VPGLDVRKKNLNAKLTVLLTATFLILSGCTKNEVPEVMIGTWVYDSDLSIEYAKENTNYADKKIQHFLGGEELSVEYTPDSMIISSNGEEMKEDLQIIGTGGWGAFQVAIKSFVKSKNNEIEVDILRTLNFEKEDRYWIYLSDGVVGGPNLRQYFKKKGPNQSGDDNSE
jgi:hypothetical protein